METNLEECLRRIDSHENDVDRNLEDLFEEIFDDPSGIELEFD